ncbi:ATP-binding protein [Cupriavidus campinensis]
MTDGAGTPTWRRWLPFVLALLLAGSLQGALAEVLPWHITSAQLRITPGGTLDRLPPQLALPAAGEAWRDTPLPMAVPRHVTPDEVGSGQIETVWVRLALPAATAAAGEPLYLYAPRWQTVGRLTVYADGEQLWQSRGGPVWNGYNYPLWIALGQAPRDIVIRIDVVGQVGAALSSVRIGTRDDLFWRYAARSFLQTQFPYLSSGGLLAVGIFSLLVWLRRRDETRYLLCFLAAGAYFLHTLQYLVGQDPLPIPEAWFSWLAFNSIAWLILACYLFIFRYLGLRYRRLEAALYCSVVFLATSTLPLSWLTHVVFLYPLSQLLLVALNLVVSIAALRAAWLARSREALTFSAWNAMSTPIAVHDVLLQNYRIDIEGIYLLSYLGCVQLLLFMVLMYRRYTSALDEVAQANANLSLRLAQREAELLESHRQLRDVERRETLTRERQRLLQDMHDGLGSSLISALRMVEKDPSGTARADDIAQVLRECIDDLKLTIDSLEPVSTDLLLLLATLRYRLGSRLEAAGISLTWDVDDIPPLQWLGAQSALHILRILQEVFTNVLKHSHATAICVQTSHDDHAVMVRVHDNGTPFDPTGVPLAHGGRGLANVQRRASALDAAVSWEPDATGTWFTLSLPIAPVTASLDVG